MADKSVESPVRIIGSRELHQNLPAILSELQKADVRFVLTVHGKPKAVLIGAESFLGLVGDRKSPSETLVGLQLSALLGGGFKTSELDEFEDGHEPKSP